jgi:hypothetical protein
MNSHLEASSSFPGDIRDEGKSTGTHFTAPLFGFPPMNHHSTIAPSQSVTER